MRGISCLASILHQKRQNSAFDSDFKDVVWFEYLYASFDIFCVQIGLIVELQGVYEEYVKIDKTPFLKENVADFEIFKNVLFCALKVTCNLTALWGSKGQGLVPSFLFLEAYVNL